MSRWLLLVLMVAALLPVLPEPLLAQEPDTPNQVDALAWSPQGDKLAVGYADGTVKIWNASSLEPVYTLQGHTDEVTSLAWKPDGSQLASGGFDTTVRVWAGGQDGTVRVWDAESGVLLATLPDISPFSVLGITWSLDSSQIYTFGFDVNQNFRIWDAQTFELLSKESNAGDVFQIAWSPERTQAALANVAGQVIIVDATTFEAVQIFDEPEMRSGGNYQIYTVAWRPDGSEVASGDAAGTIRLWNLATAHERLSLQGTDNQEPSWETTTVQALHFSSDGSQLASVTADGTFRTWDANTGQILDTTQLPITPIFAAAWSPDGIKLAYGGLEGVVILALS